MHSASVNPNEAAFESEICAWLVEHGGYDAGTPTHFDAVRGHASGPLPGVR